MMNAFLHSFNELFLSVIGGTFFMNPNLPTVNLLLVEILKSPWIPFDKLFYDLLCEWVKDCTFFLI